MDLLLGWAQWVVGFAVGDGVLETLGRLTLLMAVATATILFIVRERLNSPFNAHRNPTMRRFVLFQFSCTYSSI